MAVATLEVSFPSGKVISADDLRSVPYFNVGAPSDINLAPSEWREGWSREYNEQAQVAHASVGNSSPSVIRKGDTYTVASLDWGDDWVHPILGAGESIVATICTDLWAVMLTDYEHWQTHGGPTVEDANNNGYELQKFQTFDVTPGRYTWTVYSSGTDFTDDVEGRVVYAKLELITAF